MGRPRCQKPLNNYIGILEDEKSMREKLRTAVTDE